MAPLQQLTKDCRLLVIDPSGSHLAYTIVDVDFKAKKSKFIKAAMLWTKGTWNRGQRFNFMRKEIQQLVNVYKPDFIRSEAFFSNPRHPVGMAVIPIINGIIEEIAWLSGLSEPEFIPPTSWRKILEIKPTKINGIKDYKEPTKQVAENLLNYKFPATILSNINDKERNLPNDITDVVAIALAVLMESNIKLFEVSSDFIQ